MSDSFHVSGDAKPDADPHGQAALILVESLIHGLAARNVITVGEAIEIMEVALEAQMALADDAHPPSAAMLEAARLLASLIASFELERKR